MLFTWILFFLVVGADFMQAKMNSLLDKEAKFFERVWTTHRRPHFCGASAAVFSALHLRRKFFTLPSRTLSAGYVRVGWQSQGFHAPPPHDIRHHDITVPRTRAPQPHYPKFYRLQSPASDPDVTRTTTPRSPCLKKSPTLPQNLCTENITHT